MIEQTGLIVEKPKLSDWVMGGETGIVSGVRVPDGDWRPYQPTSELQSKQFIFDTKACATFSALNTIEYQLNYLIKHNLIPTDILAELTALGFIVDGHFNASDRFTAIVSGTTKNGNKPTKVWDTIRKLGLLPEADLPFTGSTWEEYYDATAITPALRAKAKRILGLLDFQYDWIFYTDNGRLEPEEIRLCRESLKYAPINGGIPYPASHAITFFAMDEDGSRDYFDHYNPVVKHQATTARVHFGLRGFVSVRNRKFPLHTFTKDLEAPLGLHGADRDVLLLQVTLNQLGLMKVTPTGYFGPITKAAVVKFQKQFGISPIGRVGPATRAKLNEICAYDRAETEPSWLGQIVDTLSVKASELLAKLR